MERDDIFTAVREHLGSLGQGDEAIDRTSQDVAAAFATTKERYPTRDVFLVLIENCPQAFVARTDSFSRIARYAELFEKKAGGLSNLAVSFLQEYVSYPKLDAGAIKDEMKPGHVAKLMAEIQKANGFEDEARVKNW